MKLIPRMVRALIFTMICTLSLIPIVQAQEVDTVWVRTFGDIGKSIAMDIEVIEDGIMVAGTKSLLPGHQPLPAAWLLKLDFDGNLIWEQQYGDDRFERAYGLACTPDSGFILSGARWEGEIPNAYIIKTDSLGNVEWEQSFPTQYDSFARDIECTPDGGYIVTGAIKHRGINHRVQIDGFLLKLDANGEQEWYETYGGGWDQDETWSVEVLEDGYAIGGRTWSVGAGMRDAVLIKTDLQGNMLWYTTHGGIYKDHIYEIQALDDGGFIATGKTESFGNGTLEKGDIWLLRFAENGDFMWRSVIGTLPTEFGRSVEVMDNGDFVVTGLTITQENQNQVFVGRANSDGDWLWYFDFGIHGMDDAWCVRKLPNGDLIVGGLTASLGPAYQDMLLFRLTETTE